MKHRWKPFQASDLRSVRFRCRRDRWSLVREAIHPSKLRRRSVLRSHWREGVCYCACIANCIVLPYHATSAARCAKSWPIAPWLTTEIFDRVPETLKVNDAVCDPLDVPTARAGVVADPETIEEPVITYDAEVIVLGCRLGAVAKACKVSSQLTTTGAAYCSDFFVGVLPSVV